MEGCSVSTEHETLHSFKMRQISANVLNKSNLSENLDVYIFAILLCTLPRIDADYRGLVPNELAVELEKSPNQLYECCMLSMHAICFVYGWTVREKLL